MDGSLGATPDFGDLTSEILDGYFCSLTEASDQMPEAPPPAGASLAASGNLRPAIRRNSS